MIMLSQRAREAIEHTQSSSFSCDLKKWMQIAEGYEKGQHAYHTTLPTDALLRLRDVMLETREYGFAKVREEQIALGTQVRELLQSRAFPVWRPRASSRRVWWSATPPTPRSKAAVPSSRWGCRPRRACRCSATKGRISRPSVWVCSGWKMA